MGPAVNAPLWRVLCWFWKWWPSLLVASSSELGRLPLIKRPADLDQTSPGGERMEPGEVEHALGEHLAA